MADTLRAVVLRGAGLEAHVSPLGATLTKLLAPDRAGTLAGADACLPLRSAAQHCLLARLRALREAHAHCA